MLECAVAAGEYCGVYHHAALYDMLGAAVLLGVLVWLYRSARVRLRYGQLFAIWAVWYGLQRFLIDFTRLALEEGGDRTLGPLTWSQWSALAAGIGGLALLAWVSKRNLPATPENDIAAGMAPAPVASDPDEEPAPVSTDFDPGQPELPDPGETDPGGEPPPGLPAAERD